MMAPSMLSPAGPAARSIAGLGGDVLVFFSVVIVVMLALIVVAARRRKGELTEHEPIDEQGGHGFIHIGGFAIPAVVFGIIFVATLREIDRHPLHDGKHYKPDIKVIAHQWWWEVHYDGLTTANEIHIPVGWPVEIELETRDVIHSFWVPELHGKVDIIPDETNHIRIEADKPGRYEGMCGEFCGGNHDAMRFVVVAEPESRYEEWLAHQMAPADDPRDQEGKQGKQVFETHACALCHTVRGTAAMASNGPDLTHVASRWAVGAYSVPNTRGWLEAWITHAQTFKPGAQMPNLAVLDGRETQALTHYVEQLQ